MTFEGLVDRLQSLFDVSQQRAVDVANERLSTMVVDSEALQAIVTLSTTVAAQTSYALAANVGKVLKARIGTVVYEGSESLEAMWDIDAGDAATNGYFYAIEPDTDADMNTSNLRLYPAPSTSGSAISGLVALRPATLTYATATALPIPVDVHAALLAGCEAELYAEESRQDQAALEEQKYAAGIRALEAVVNGRAKGTGRRRMRVVGYDTPLSA